MEEDIKNDLAGIAFSHPFFSDIVTGVLNYIKKLEEEVESQDKTIDNLIKEQEEREKYTHSLEEEKESYRIGWCNKGEELEKYKNNSIPISVIQNKINGIIEELYEEMEECNNYDEDYNEEKRQLTDMIVLLKEVLQELLEERNK